ncbi:hypothetical protein MMC25_001520 [Agyrium rufum]|nr:hypothetical protein [Agyrium rufum]
MITSTAISLPQFCDQLRSAKGLTPLRTWVSDFLSSQKQGVNINALIQTAAFRLLASDITQTFDQSVRSCLPSDLTNGQIKERRLEGSIIFQILNIEDISKSRWQQIKAIEALERGEGTKGREIIRVVPDESNEDSTAGANASSGEPHKFLLQDARGARVYGIELSDVQSLSLSMNIGIKILLNKPIVARGVVLLEPTTARFLGGKIEELHKSWKENRKANLKAAIEATEQDRGRS